ncbi:MAG: tetratricopeptide repeat protein, partial [Bryobacteraceae bacterium]
QDAWMLVQFLVALISSGQFEEARRVEKELRTTPWDDRDDAIGALLGSALFQFANGSADQANRMMDEAIALTDDEDVECKLSVMQMSAFLKALSGDFQSARWVLQKAATITDRDTSADDFFKIPSLLTEALLAIYEQNTELGVKNILEALQQMAESPSDESSQLIAVQLALATGAIANLDDPRVPELQQRLANKVSDLLGPEHPVNVIALSAIANAAIRSEHFTAAERFINQALEIHLKRLPKTHCNYVALLASLGDVHRRVHSFETAESELNEALQQSRRIQPRAPLLTARIKVYLGNLCIERRQFVPAQAHLSEALAIIEGSVGKDSMESIEARQALASLAVARGEIRLALDLHLKNLTICRVQAGRRTECSAAALYNIGWVAASARDFSRAESSFREALDIEDQIYGKADPEIARTMSGFASGVLITEGKYSEADTMLESSIEIDAARQLPPGPETVRRVADRAFIAYMEENYELAKSLYAREAALRKTLDFNEPEDMVGLRRAQAFLGFEQADVEACANSSANLIEDSEKFSGSTRSVAREITGLCALLQNDLPRAKREILKSIEIERLATGETSQAYGERLHAYAEYLLTAREYNEAKQQLKRALNIKEKAVGANHPLIIRTVEKLAQVCDLLNQTDESRTLYMRELQITERTMGNQAPRYVRLSKMIAPVQEH